MLSLEQIEQAHGERHTVVEMPEWGGEVRARRLTISDRLALEKLSAKGEGERDGGEYTVRMVQMSLVDDDDRQLIGDDNLYLLTENYAALSRLAVALNKFNENREQKGDPAGNSVGGP